MTRNDLKKRLQRGIFISSMMHITDGEWVSVRGRSTQMVQIGALVADALDHSHDPRSLLPQDQRFMVSIMRREMEIIRAKLHDIPVALNAAPGEIESAQKMARAFLEAGGDILELNCHGGYEKLLKRGLLRAMALPENRETLLLWLRTLCMERIPIIVKFNSLAEGVDFPELLQAVSGLENLFGVHINIRSKDQKTPNIEFVREVRSVVKGVFLCSGYVIKRDQADALFEAGADCVGIGQGILDNSDIFSEF